MTDKDDLETVLRVPEETDADIAHRNVEAILSAFPVIGGPAAKVFAYYIVPPIEKRRGEWMRSVASVLIALVQKVDGFKLDDLSKNETFITIVMHATSVAIRNHQKEKLEALRNVVLNSALPSGLDEDMQLIFINLVDVLTPSHLRELKLCAELLPVENTYSSLGLDYFKEQYSQMIKQFFPEIDKPEMKEQIGLYSQIFRDLLNYGLIGTSDFAIGPPTETIDDLIGDTVRIVSITDMGKQFIEFITSPIGNIEEIYDQK